MKKKKLKLHSKILIMNILVITISIIIALSFFIRLKFSSIRKEIEVNIMNTARIVANSDIIINSLSNKSPGGKVQIYIETILRDTKKIDILVVADMSSTRYAHPSKNRIGKTFVGGDEVRVIENGESYISEAIGTLGSQLRAFAPVYNLDGIQIGFIMASTLTKSIEEEKVRAVTAFLLISFFGIFMGIISATLLSKNIKNSLLGFEPEVLSKLYLQKTEVLDAMEEGIIAIDKNFVITHCNKKAIDILKIKDYPIIGLNITEVVPFTKLTNVLSSGTYEYNKELHIGNSTIMANRIPIKEGKKVMGAVAIFRDKTEVTELAEEITGVKQIVEALRANTHEFMNKLHVILGLIQMNKITDAKKYIVSQTKQQQLIINKVIKNIEDPTIGALILGKISKAKESGIILSLDMDSNLSKNIGRISNNSIITILGNLIDNSIDAINQNEDFDKRIDLLIKEEKKQIKILIKDTGVGVEEKNFSKIFTTGFSSKGESRGRGLNLIKEIVENLDGSIKVESKINKGTKFTIILVKERTNG
ncbi:ATP-binding protein [Clostridium sediminicola]|uniref:ATP-binding protein n=1 Tax=Clostridium sediminicola TaxID=3114879 RepID=UPI003D168103